MCDCVLCLHEQNRQKWYASYALIIMNYIVVGLNTKADLKTIEG